MNHPRELSSAQIAEARTARTTEATASLAGKATEIEQTLTGRMDLTH